jgi:CheY-like chemotaxis protein
MTNGGLPWRVLVVDDETDLRVLVRLTLECDDRLEVAGMASSADEALAMAESLSPDLVILDQMLGGPLTGLDVAARLRATNPAIRIILFTAAEEFLGHHESVDFAMSKTDIEVLPHASRMLLESAAAVRA